jgi:hypothetical protein
MVMRGKVLGLAEEAVSIYVAESPGTVPDEAGLEDGPKDPVEQLQLERTEEVRPRVIEMRFATSQNVGRENGTHITCSTSCPNQGWPQSPKAL